MNILTFAVLFVFGILTLSLAKGEHKFDVLHYGAKGDGHAKDTEAIAKAIDAAAKVNGTVVFPKGHHFFTGPIHLKSHITLHLEDHVVIKFSDHFDDYYPMVEIRDGASLLHNFSPLVYGHKVSHVTITGGTGATFDGSGKKWWDFFKTLKEEHAHTGHWSAESKWQKEFLKANHGKRKAGDESFIRPYLFQVIDSDHITVKGVTFENSPFFTVFPVFTDHITFDHVTVKNPWNSPNTDGIDPYSCKHVLITHAHVSTGDDCVCIKSGGSRPSENITVVDSTMHAGHGGIVFGSGISGGVRNVIVKNLHFQDTNIGIRIKFAIGRGGVMENVHISDITMKNITHEAISIDAAYKAANHGADSSQTPTLHDLHIKNVTGESKLGIVIHGNPHKHFGSIELTNVHVTSKHPISILNADHVTQKNVTVTLHK